MPRSGASSSRRNQQSIPTPGVFSTVTDSDRAVRPTSGRRDGRTLDDGDGFCVHTAGCPSIEIPATRVATLPTRLQPTVSVRLLKRGEVAIAANEGDSRNSSQCQE